MFPQVEQAPGAFVFEIDHALKVVPMSLALLFGVGAAVSVDAGHPGTGVALCRRPALQCANAVPKVGEHGASLGRRGARNVRIQPIQRGGQAGQGVPVELFGHAPAALLTDEFEEHVPPQVVDVRVVGRADHEVLVIAPVLGRNGLQVGDERAHPRPQPDKAEVAVERHDGEVSDGLLYGVPGGDECPGVGRSGPPLGQVRQHGVDGSLRSELCRADDTGVGPEGGFFEMQQAAEGADGLEARLAQRRQLLVQQPGVRDAQQGLHVKRRCRRIADFRFDAARPVRFEQGLLARVEGGVKDGPGQTGLFGIVGVVVRQVVAAHQKGGRLDAESVAQAGHDDVMFLLERLDPQQHFEAGVDLGGRLAHEAEPAQCALRRRLRDLRMVSPFADQVGAAVAAHVERGGVFEAGAAVVGPDGEVVQFRHGLHQAAHQVAVVIPGDGMILRQGVAGQVRAERVVDAGTPQGRMALEEVLGQAARLEAEQPGPEAVRLPQGRQPAEPVQVGLQVGGRVKPPRQRAVDEVVETRTVRVEGTVELGGYAELERDVEGQPVDFEVGEAGSGQALDVRLRVEPPRGAGHLGQHGVEEGALEGEGRLDQNSFGEGRSGPGRQAVGQEVHQRVEQGRGGGRERAPVLAETGPHPGGRRRGGGRSELPGTVRHVQVEARAGGVAGCGRRQAEAPAQGLGGRGDGRVRLPGKGGRRRGEQGGRGHFGTFVI